MNAVAKDDQYVLNHRTRFLPRDNPAIRHDFGQYDADDSRARICEAWWFPIIDSHWDGTSAATSYAFNGVTFVYDARDDRVPRPTMTGAFAPGRRRSILG